MPDDLKPCPWCPVPPKEFRTHKDLQSARFWAGCANPDCPVHPVTKPGYTDAESARTAWNRRAEDE